MSLISKVFKVHLNVKYDKYFWQHDNSFLFSVLFPISLTVFPACFISCNTQIKKREHIIRRLYREGMVNIIPFRNQDRDNALRITTYYQMAAKLFLIKGIHMSSLCVYLFIIVFKCWEFYLKAKNVNIERQLKSTKDETQAVKPTRSHSSVYK